MVERNDALIVVDDERMVPRHGEAPMRRVRFRTLGCYPLTGAIESSAETLSEIIRELHESTTSERKDRMIDSDSVASIETKKQEGNF